MIDIMARSQPVALRNFVIAVAVSIATALYLGFMLQSLLGLQVGTAFNVFVLTFFIALIFMSYSAYFATRTQKRFVEPSDAQKNMSVSINRMFVGDRIVRRIVMRMFDSDPIGGKIDEQLIFMTRRSQLFVLWIPLVLSWLVAWLCLQLPELAVAAWQGIGNTADQQANASSAIAPNLHRGYDMLVVLVFGLIDLWIWLNWVSTIVVLTNRGYARRTEYPLWLTWLPESNFGLTIKEVGSLGVKQSMTGKLFGFGRLGPDTPSEEDKRLRLITKVPRAELLAAAIRDAQSKS